MFAVVVKEWKFFCIQFCFVLCIFVLFSLIFAYSIFSPFVTRQRKRIKFVVFLEVIHIKLSSFCWYFLILWQFIHWTLNKRCLETWSCVCGYCRLFLCFSSLWNISKKLGRVVRKMLLNVNLGLNVIWRIVFSCLSL